jgi:hypothetical protein
VRRASSSSCCATGHYVVETCDIANRTLHCRVDERAGLSAGNNVETTWQWKPGPGEAGPEVTLYCMMMCGSDPDGGQYIEGHTTIPD